MKHRNRFSTVVWVVGIFLASFIVLWPLINPGFFVSDDGEWMIIRLSAFYQSLAEGQFPVRFLGRLNHSYGYPVANFLYPGFLYIGSVIHYLGLSFVDSVKVILAGSVVGAALLLFLGLRRRYTVISSFIGALGYLFMPYLSFDMYTRGSVGEIFAMFSAILAWFSIERRKIWIFPWAIALLLVSHNSLALVFIIFLIGYMLAGGISGYWRPLFLGIGIATFFWFPAIYERRFVWFDAITVANPSGYFVDTNRLYLLNVVPIIAAIVLFTGRQKQMASRTGNFIIVSFLVATVLATPLAAGLWRLPIFVKLFQFPYRFLSLGALAGPWLIATVIERTKKSGVIWLCLLFGVTWFIPLWMRLAAVDPIVREEGYYTTNEGTTTVANEYMPHWVGIPPKQRAERPIEFFLGKGTITLGDHSTQTIGADVEAEEQSVVQMNTIYYPGWGAQIDGLPVRIDYQNAGGVMRIPVPAGKHHVTAQFRETVPRFLADVVSLVFVVFGMIFSMRELTKKRGEKS